MNAKPRTIAIAAAAICLPFHALFALMIGAAAVQQQSCDTGTADAGDPIGAPTGALGGIGGTGITRAELATVRGGRAPRVSPGTYVTTAYGPPWGGIQGQGIATSAGLRINGGAPEKYFVAVDPARISYGSWVYIWPNPFGWRGAFLAADTGGAIRGNRIDFYDWRGRLTQNGWGRREARVSARPVAPIPPGVLASVNLGRTLARHSVTGSAASSSDGAILTVGDSLAVGSAADLRRQLDSSRRLIVDAVAGRSSTSGVEALRRHASQSDVWVIQLGTNDASAAVLRRSVRAAKDLARPHGAALIWVNIARRPIGSSTDTSLNRVLADELEASQIIDWHANHPPLLDGVHPSAAGYRTRASLIAQTLSGDAPGVDTGTSDGPEAAGGCEVGLAGAGGTGQIEFAPGANRPGAEPTADLKRQLGLVAGIYGKKIVVTTGTNHNQFTTSGSVSDHWAGNAADIGSAANGFPIAGLGQAGGNGDKIAAAAMVAAGVSPARAVAQARAGGLCNVVHGGFRWQIIWKTIGAALGGNHTNHVHIGVRRQAGRVPMTCVS
jgi:3D (Asp-Asp-Asp) domain-containing protein/lysophospholipase L1-like esterase